MREASTHGLFFVLEGIDGSGKSTQTRHLAARLRAEGFSCRETREPTEAPIGALLRRILSGDLSADPHVIATLFAADRIEHVTRPGDGLCAMLSQGESVVCDRYYFSSYAYHGVDMDMDWVIHTNAPSAERLRPSLTIFLDVPIETALERLRSNRPQLELYETEERLRAVRSKYFEAFENLQESERISIVSADASEALVAERVWTAVSAYLKASL